MSKDNGVVGQVGNHNEDTTANDEVTIKMDHSTKGVTVTIGEAQFFLTPDTLLAFTNALHRAMYQAVFSAGDLFSQLEEDSEE